MLPPNLALPPQDRSPRIVVRSSTTATVVATGTTVAATGGDDNIRKISMDDEDTITKQQTKRRWMAAAADHDREIKMMSTLKEIPHEQQVVVGSSSHHNTGGGVGDSVLFPTQQIRSRNNILQPLPQSQQEYVHVEQQQQQQQQCSFHAPLPPPPRDDDVSMGSQPNDNVSFNDDITMLSSLNNDNGAVVQAEAEGEGGRDSNAVVAVSSDFDVKKKHSIVDHDSTEEVKKKQSLLKRVLRSTIRSPLIEEETTNNNNNDDNYETNDKLVNDDKGVVVDDVMNWQNITTSGDHRHNHHHHAATDHDDMSRSDVSSLTEAISVTIENNRKSRLWNPFATSSSSPIIVSEQQHHDATPTTIVTTTSCGVGTPPRHPSRTSSRSPTPVVTNNNNPMLVMATALLRSLSPSNSSRGVGGGGGSSSSGGSYSSGRGGGCSTNGSGGGSGGRGGGSSTVNTTRGGDREYDILTSASSFPSTPGGKISSCGGSHSSSLERAMNATSIQNTDRSLETRLYENGSKRNLFDNILGRVRTTSGDIVVGGSSRQHHHRTSKSEQLCLPLEGRGMSTTAIYVSPLGRAIDQERITTSPGGSPQRIGSIAEKSPSRETRQYQTVVAVPRHRRVQSGITGSGSISMKIPPPMPLHQRSRTQGNTRLSSVGVDLMDVACDSEPVDPFSGLIGMHHSIVACEDNEASHIFGIPTLSKSTSSGTFLSDDDGTPRSLHSSSQDGSSGQSPLVKPSSSGEFDPLLDGQQQQHTTKEEWLLNNVGGSNSPARHYKDDPLLANSRYRYPSWTGTKQSPKKKSLHKLPLTHRTSSGGGSECMLGKITQLEVGKLPAAVSELTLIGEEFYGESSMTNNTNIDGRRHCATSFSDEVVIAPTTTPFTTHNTTTTTTSATTTRGERNNERGENSTDYDDNSSDVQSFSDEFRRHNKGIKQEVKLIVNPFVTKGRKLLRRSSDNAALKRSDGCLT
jgi:hypothetical protein